MQLISGDAVNHLCVLGFFWVDEKFDAAERFGAGLFY
jgi:hypothetical protein